MCSVHGYCYEQDLQEAKVQMEQLKNDYERLDCEAADAGALNKQLEEHVASLMQECRDTEIQKQWVSSSYTLNPRSTWGFKCKNRVHIP